MQFKNWLINEFKDVFGFDNDVQRHQQNHLGTGGYDSPKPELIISELSHLKLGVKQPISEYYDTIAWGDGSSGTISLELSPYGSYKAVIRKKCIDLEGTSTWVCKRIIALNELEFKNNEPDIAENISKELENIDLEMLDSTNREYNELEKLASKLFSHTKRYAPLIFISPAVKKINENEYIISYELRGQGVESPGRRRVEKFNINLNYNEHRGLIRCIGCDISSPKRGHLWQTMPSEFDENFMPSQSSEEICNAIINAFKAY